ncbi:hypothetical protein F1L18_17835 [Escherichia coli]|nr:hypothetical protein F1L18_17835 [Escherichia coli]
MEPEHPYRGEHPLHQPVPLQRTNRSSQCQERNTNNRNYEYESIDVRNRGRAQGKIIRSSLFVLNNSHVMFKN